MADGKSCTDQLDQAYTVTLIRGTCGIDAIENQGSWRATTQGSSRSLTCLSAAGILINYIMAIESQHQPENVGESVSCITEDEDLDGSKWSTALTVLSPVVEVNSAPSIYLSNEGNEFDKRSYHSDYYSGNCNPEETWLQRGAEDFLWAPMPSPAAFEVQFHDK